jgi:hypothetical protein
MKTQIYFLVAPNKYPVMEVIVYREYSELFIEISWHQRNFLHSVQFD